MLGARQPVAQHFEKTSGAHFGRGVQIFGKRSNGAFIDFEKKSILAAEVLEDGSFGDAQPHRNVPNASGVITMLGEMLGGGLNDSGSFCLRARAGRALPLIERRRKEI